MTRDRFYLVALAAAKAAPNDKALDELAELIAEEYAGRSEETAEAQFRILKDAVRFRRLVLEGAWDRAARGAGA